MMDIASNKQIANDVLARMQAGIPADVDNAHPAAPINAVMPNNVPPPAAPPQPAQPAQTPPVDQVQAQQPDPDQGFPASPTIPTPQPMVPTAQNLSNFAQAHGANAMQRTQDASDLQGEAAVLDGQAKVATAKASEPAYAAQTADAQSRQKLYAERTQAIQQRADQAIQGMREVSDRQKEMLATHPDGIWQKSGVNPIAGSIGLLLGAFNKGTGNSAMDSINHKIDQNIAAQKTQFDQLGKLAEGYNNTYANLHSQLGDETAVSKQMKDLSYDSVAAMLQEAANKTANSTVKANVAKSLADIETLKAKNLNELDEHIVTQQTAAVTAHTAEGTLRNANDKNRIDEENNNWSHEDRMLKIAADADKAAAAKKEKVGITGVSGSENLGSGDLTKLQAKVAGGEKVNNAIDELLSNTNIPLSDRLFNNTEARANLYSAIREAQGLSTRVSGAEGALLEKMAGWAQGGYFGDLFATMKPEEVQKNLEEVRRVINKDVRSEVKSWNGLQVNPDSYLYEGSKEQGATPQGTAQQTAKDILKNTPAH